MPSSANQRVTILCGGQSDEHPISLLSAQFVVQALQQEAYDVRLLGIDREGTWWSQDKSAFLAQDPDPRRIALQREGSTFSPWSQERAALGVVFPVLHGPHGEDGKIQGLLDSLGVPYVGSGVLGSAVGMDKDVMKRLLSQAGLPIVAHCTLRAAAWERSRESCLESCGALPFPLFIKPANLGSSVGVSRAVNRLSLHRGIEEAFRYDRKVVVEQGLSPVREIECAVLGHRIKAASLPGEVVVSHADGFYSYAAKYLDSSGSQVVIPAPLTEGQTARIRELALLVFDALEASGLARVDFFLSSEGQVFVNEINTMPGFTAISMYPKMWEASGVPAGELVTRLIEAARERFEEGPSHTLIERR